MRNPESHAGNYAWAGLIGAVALWDVFAPETMSHAVDRYLQGEYSRYIAVGAIAITAAHLLNILPRGIDPFISLEHGTDTDTKAS